jgi:hypothetical protein
MDVLGWMLRAAVVLLGRIIGYLVGSHRAVSTKRREVRALALAEAYRKIVRAGDGLGASQLGLFDEALTDIQLLGTTAQVARAADVAHALNAGAADALEAVDTLLEHVRTDVRAELQLDPSAPPLVRVRRSPPPARRAATPDRLAPVIALVR